MSVCRRGAGCGDTVRSLGDDMTEWIIRRWSRYGHERLYAETPGGTPLGYLDLKTGRYHSDDLSNLPLLEKAIGHHRGSDALGTPSVLPGAPAPPPAVQDEVRPSAAPCSGGEISA